MKIGQFVRFKKNIKRLKELLKKKKEQELKSKKKPTKKDIKISQMEKVVRKQQLKTIPIIIPLAILSTITQNIIKKDTKEEQEKYIGQDNIEKIDKNKKLTSEEKEEVKENIVEVKKEQQEEPSIIRTYSKEDEELLEKEISKVKANKIIEEYENRLKDLRWKLRKAYYDDDILKEAKELEDNPSEKNLEKLNDLIEKLDKLRNKVKVESKIDIEKDYLSVLVQEDIKKIEETKKENLKETDKIYKDLSVKVETLKQIEEKVEEKVEEKKINNNIDEEEFNKLKEKEADISKFNNEFIKFQNEQSKIISDVHMNIPFQENVNDIARIQLNGMFLSSNLAMRNVRRNMRTPGVRSGKKVYNLLATFLYSFSMINTTRPVRKQYKNIHLEEMSASIENNINEIDNMLLNLSKTSNQITRNINLFIKMYEQFKDTDQYKKILANLEQMRRNIEEKEYELQRIKARELERQREIERAKQKVYRKEM